MVKNLFLAILLLAGQLLRAPNWHSFVTSDEQATAFVMRVLLNSLNPYYALSGLHKINSIHTGLSPGANIFRRFQGLIQNSQPQ